MESSSAKLPQHLSSFYFFLFYREGGWGDLRCDGGECSRNKHQFHWRSVASVVLWNNSLWNRPCTFLGRQDSFMLKSRNHCKTPMSTVLIWQAHCQNVRLWWLRSAANWICILEACTLCPERPIPFHPIGAHMPSQTEQGPSTSSKSRNSIPCLIFSVATGAKQYDIYWQIVINAPHLFLRRCSTGRPSPFGTMCHGGRRKPHCDDSRTTCRLGPILLFS